MVCTLQKATYATIHRSSFSWNSIFIQGSWQIYIYFKFGNKMKSFSEFKTYCTKCTEQTNLKHWMILFMINFKQFYVLCKYVVYYHKLIGWIDIKTFYVIWWNIYVITLYHILRFDMIGSYWYIKQTDLYPTRSRIFRT